MVSECWGLKQRQWVWLKRLSGPFHTFGGPFQVFRALFYPFLGIFIHFGPFFIIFKPFHHNFQAHFIIFKSFHHSQAHFHRFRPFFYPFPTFLTIISKLHTSQKTILFRIYSIFLIFQVNDLNILPKYLCSICHIRITTFHEFYCTVYEAQQTFVRRMIDEFNVNRVSDGYADEKNGYRISNCDGVIDVTNEIADVYIDADTFDLDQQRLESNVVCPGKSSASIFIWIFCPTSFLIFLLHSLLIHFLILLLSSSFSLLMFFIYSRFFKLLPL